MKSLLLLLISSSPAVIADIVFENELIKPEEVFDTLVLKDSTVDWLAGNVTKYYCVFRGMWTKVRQPALYPDLARFTTPVLFSGNKQFIPYLKNRATTYGIEKIAESGFTDTFQQEVRNAGEWVKSYIEADQFFINNDDPEENYAYFKDGLLVDSNHPFISGISAMNPSPDWFTGFYLHQVIDEYDRTFWDRFKIHTYPWDAGTDAGRTYTDVDRDLEMPQNVGRIFKENAPNGDIFVGSDGTSVPPIAEWECVLHTCPTEQPECVKENWPPVNGCDVLKYAGCDVQCTPGVDPICQECKPKALDTGKVHYQNCCQSRYEPMSGDCNNPGAYLANGAGGSGVNDNNNMASRCLVSVGVAVVMAGTLLLQ